MPRILITGNGFDLHHNLPTSYQDFIKVTNYVINYSDYNSDTIYTNTSIKDFKTHFPNEIILENNLIEELKVIAENNLFFKYFSEELELETWIDFEIKIELILKIIYNAIKCIRTSISDQKGIDISTFSSNISYLKILEFLKILTKQEKAKNDFRNAQYKINAEYCIIKYDILLNIDEEKIILDLYKDFLQFKKSFSLYIQTFVNPLYTQIPKGYFGKFSDKITYHFSFNYTPTFKTVYQSRIHTHYLHGKSESSNENIVFGINELFSKEDIHKSYLRFTKYFQTISYSTDYSFLNTISHSAEQTIVYIWGHSLNISDSYYINDIIKKIGNCYIPKIYIIYRDTNSKEKLVENLYNYIDKETLLELFKKKIIVFEMLTSGNLNNSFDKLERKKVRGLNTTYKVRY